MLVQFVFLFIPLFIERVIEIFDTFVILPLFPWWATDPVSPPIALLPRPYAEKHLPAAVSGRQPTGQVVNLRSVQDTITYAVGDNTLEVSLNSPDEAQFYYEREERLHQQRLRYYLRYYGFFLDEKKNLARRLWPRWIRAVGEVLQDRLLNFEKRLAQQQAVSQLPGMSVSELRTILSDSYPVDDTTQKLELWANYCYLRNQQTYEAFRLRKRQLYFFLGPIIGMILALLFDGNSFLVNTAAQNTHIAFLGLQTIQNGWNSNANYFIWAGLGMGATPTHFVVNRLPRSRPQPSSPYAAWYVRPGH